MVEFRKPNVVLTMVDSVVTRGLLQVLSTGELVGSNSVLQQPPRGPLTTFRSTNSS